MSERFDLRRFTQEVEAGLSRWVPAVIQAAQARLTRGGLGFGPVERRDVLAAEAALSDAGPQGLAAAWHHELMAVVRAVSSRQVEDDSRPPVLDEDAGTLQLTLKDEQEVDEEIELSHLIQNLESGSERLLRDLRALCSALRSWPVVRTDAPPLHPQALAQSLGRAARRVPMSAVARLVLLRAVVAAASEVLPEVLAAQLRMLKGAGVQPAEFRLMARQEPIRSGVAPSESDRPALAAVTPGDDAPEGRVQAVLQQLLERSGYAGEGSPGPAGQVSDAWMQGVVQAVLEEAAPAPRMRQIMQRLTAPAMQLARAEPELWRQPEHAWWLLLDRLLALCAVLEAGPGGAQDQVADRCEAAVTRLCSGQPPDSQLCREVLEEVETAGRTIAEAQESMAAPVAGPAGPDLTRMVREQIVQQLRSSAAPSSIRRFLMGPWLRVMVASLDPRAGQPALASRYTDWVDALLAALRSTPTPAALEALLATASEGLAFIGLAEVQIDTWLFDLSARLHEVRHEIDAAQPAWKHEDLPTVPIDLHGSVHGARARRDRVAWINGLRVGDICHMFLDGQWCTVQLIVDPVAAGLGDEAYVFQSRNPRRQQSLTRGALERLRAEGLATTVESGTFIARALDTVAATLDELSVHRRP